MATIDVLRPVTFGQRVAEEEGESLAGYFVETDQWRRLFSDDVDIVYGQKGAGKSALYSLLVARKSELFDKGVLLATAENPRGAPVFRSLVTDPPSSEREFRDLWKLYLACLASATLAEFGVPGRAADKLQRELESAGLRPRSSTLQGLLRAVFDYVKRFRPGGLEGSLALDPITQQPSGVTGRILFAEPTASQAEQGLTSVDHLLTLADEALSAAGYRAWLLLDRLDVAFSDSIELEQNALRALFHVYLDLLGHKALRLKIFLRTDVWRRITTTGFREASHITRSLTIEWNRASLMNLVAMRIALNEPILSHYGLTRGAALASASSQEQLFYNVFPDQVEAGQRKPNTFDWMLGRTADATRQTAPRELIHLLNSLRDVQVKRLELGDAEPEGGRLFARLAFKEALPEVSRARLEQTLYAEYPETRSLIEKLRGGKTQLSSSSLSEAWGLLEGETLHWARRLVEIGFFEQRGEKDNPSFWVPLLYRDALDLVQGAAE